jgi:holo-[acyl-carrier protein] synthase
MIMIIGIGLDLVDIARLDMIVRRFDRKFLERVFTADELAYCMGKKTPAMHLAGRFAAKEACAKALGCGIGARAGWRDFEVGKDAAGQPALVLTGRAGHLAGTLGVAGVFLSITHTENHAAATVVLEG